MESEQDYGLMTTRTRTLGRPARSPVRVALVTTHSRGQSPTMRLVVSLERALAESLQLEHGDRVEVFVGRANTPAFGNLALRLRAVPRTNAELTSVSFARAESGRLPPAATVRVPVRDELEAVVGSPGEILARIRERERRIRDASYSVAGEMLYLTLPTEWQLRRHWQQLRLA